MSLPIRLSEKATPLESSGITVVMEVNSSLPVKSDFHTLHVSLRRYFKLQRGKLIINPPDQCAKDTNSNDVCPVQIGRGWEPSGFLSCDGKEDNQKVDSNPAPWAQCF